MNTKQKTIGIVTLDDYTNYGNRLQNFALTKLLENEGFQVINGIRVFTKTDWIEETDSWVKRIVKRFIPFCFIKNRVEKKLPIKTGLLADREKRFIEFINEYTQLIEPVIELSHKRAYKSLQKKGVHNFVVGSDQVWNPYYGGKGYEFLAFVPMGRRFSFAASIGIRNIPSNKLKYYKKHLSKMTFLSVREDAGAKIIYELTGRSAAITLDPTLLLDRREWKKITKRPNLPLENEYICTYFLGEEPKAVEVFSKSMNLPVYRLNSEKDKKLFTINPAEFLYMIENATYILTDSFHAMAFSIKFHKEFYVFKRKQDTEENMFSRIETIAKRFSLGNRIQNREYIESQDAICNWDTIDCALVSEKNRCVTELIRNMEMYDAKN